MDSQSEKKKLMEKKGARLKEIRNQILCLSQTQFIQWLYEHGIYGKYDEPLKIVTISAWENGRRNIPDTVLKTIYNNVTYDGFQLRWDYIIGNDDKKTLAFFSSEEIDNMSISLKNEVFLKTVLPSLTKYMILRGYDMTQIKHPDVFIQGVRINIDKFIEDYIKFSK